MAKKKENLDNSVIMDKINYFRHLKGWSLYELALQADLSSATLYEWSSNKKQPSLSNITKICNALSISLSQFFAMNGNEQLSAFEIDLINVCEQMNNEQQQALLHVARVILNGKR